MQTISWRGARGAKRAVRLGAILIMTAACDDQDHAGSLPASDPGAAGFVTAGTASVYVTANGASTNTAGNLAGANTADNATVLASGAAGASGVPSAIALAPSLPRTAVAAAGVIGTMIETSFLSDAGNGRRNLILVDWEIPAGTEQYLCGRLTVTEDVYLHGFQPLSPLGTHHTALTVLEQPDAPDGVTECDLREVGTRNVFGSGIGTPAKTLPDGIAMKLARGSQILLNLHLYNVSDAPLRGRSGTLVETTSLALVKELADGIAAGPFKLSVPPGRSVQTGKCTVDRDYTLFSVIPHMHQMGVHMKVVAERAVGGRVVLHDDAYDFDNQVSYRFEPLEMKTGDSVAIECTYANTSNLTLHFGESSNDEMCIAGLSRFPAGGSSVCAY
jgi:hypothetical protein